MLSTSLVHFLALALQSGKGPGWAGCLGWPNVHIPFSCVDQMANLAGLPDLRNKNFVDIFDPFISLTPPISFIAMPYRVHFLNIH